MTPQDSSGIVNRKFNTQDGCKNKMTTQHGSSIQKDDVTDQCYIGTKNDMTAQFGGGIKKNTVTGQFGSGTKNDMTAQCGSCTKRVN